MENFESLTPEPLFKMRCFATPDFVAEIADDKFLFPDETGVCRENHIRKTRLRIDQGNIDGQLILYKPAQVVPLLPRGLRIALTASAHPGIDFIFDAVIVGRAHEKTHTESGG